MVANNALIDDILGVILQNPELHDQLLWIGEQADGHTTDDVPCGTTACVAGWAVILAAPPGTRLMRMDTHLDQVEVAEAKLPSGEIRSVWELATELLQLSINQAHVLFNSRTSEAAIARLKYLKDHPGASKWDLLNFEA